MLYYDFEKLHRFIKKHKEELKEVHLAISGYRDDTEEVVWKNGKWLLPITNNNKDIFLQEHDSLFDLETRAAGICGSRLSTPMLIAIWKDGLIYEKNCYFTVDYSISNAHSEPKAEENERMINKSEWLEKQLQDNVRSALAMAELRLKYVCMNLESYTPLERKLIELLLASKGYEKRETSSDGITDFILA